MSKTLREKAEERRAADARAELDDRARAAREGNVFCFVANGGYPAFTRTLDEARAVLDRFVREREVPIPTSYYEASASVRTMHVHLEHFADSRWSVVPDSLRTIVTDVVFHERK